MNSKWEMGSSFHSCSSIELSSRANELHIEDTQLYLCGRSALLDLISYQIKFKEIVEIYLPSYYCHDVTRALEKIITVRLYNCDPLSIIDLIGFPKNSAIVVVEYFGNKAKVIQSKEKLTIILDKTHDPFSDYSYNFKVDYSFGSLRKIFPISDGGFLKPRLNSLQSSLITDEASIEVLKIQDAMKLKYAYLIGSDIDKESFLRKFSDFEQYLDSITDIYPMSDMSYKKLLSLDYNKIIATKEENIEYLNNYYRQNSKFRILENKSYFSILIAPQNISYVKSALISKSIYPINLWLSYDGNYDLIDGLILLSMHVDFRYSLQDLEILIQKIDEIFYES